MKYLPINEKEAVEKYIEKLSYARKDGKYIDVPINDIAEKNAIEGLLDEQNMLLHSQLNSKTFRILIDDLLGVVLLFESDVAQEDKTIESLQQEIIGNLKSQQGELEGIEGKIDISKDKKIPESLKVKLLQYSPKLGVVALLPLIPSETIDSNILQIILYAM